MCFTLKQLLIAVLVLSVCSAVYFGLSRKVVSIREAGADDPIHKRYFGIDGEAGFAIRNIAVVEGSFSRSTWLSATLYAVRSGKIDEINSFAVGRSPNRIGEWYWEGMRLTLALGEKKTPIGRLVQLGSHGQTRGGGEGREISLQTESKFSSVLPCSLGAGGPFVVYAEGDAKPRIEQRMTVDEFVRANSGNFFVVAVALH
jgi:hypothetical protein